MSIALGKSNAIHDNWDEVLPYIGTELSLMRILRLQGREKRGNKDSRADTGESSSGGYTMLVLHSNMLDERALSSLLFSA